MISIVVIRILFFCLIPIGIFILYRGIKILRCAFNGELLLELPYLKQVGEFTILKSGTYAVWQKGEAFKKTPLSKFGTHIYEKSNQQEIKLSHSLLSPHSNDFSNGRMEIYTFYATPGVYELKLTEGSSASGIQSVIAKLIPLPNADLSKYFIQIRESQSQWLTLLGIPIIILGGCGVIGGFALGILADQIFK